MGLEAIILRILQDPKYITKNSELTWVEEDYNFKIIADAISELQAQVVAGIPDYVPSQEYSNGNDVVYNGNTWTYINNIPSTGITPGSDISRWKLASTGQYAHQQNTDAGTSATEFYLGSETKRIRINQITGVFEFTNDGINWITSQSKFTSDFVVTLSGGKTLGKLTNGQTARLAGKTLQQGLEYLGKEEIPATVSINGFALQEKGTSFTPTITGTITPNSYLVTARRVKRGGTTIATPATNSISFQDSAQTANQSYTIEFDWEGLDADGNNITGTTSSGAAGLTFVAPSYYGTGAAGLSEAQIKGLSKNIWLSSNRSDLIFNPVVNRYYFVEPAAYPVRTKIYDPSGFDFITDFDITTQTFTLADGVTTESMRKYIGKFDSTQTNYPIDFIF